MELAALSVDERTALTQRLAELKASPVIHVGNLIITRGYVVQRNDSPNNSNNDGPAGYDLKRSPARSLTRHVLRLAKRETVYPASLRPTWQACQLSH